MHPELPQVHGLRDGRVPGPHVRDRLLQSSDEQLSGQNSRPGTRREHQHHHTEFVCRKHQNQGENRRQQGGFGAGEELCRIRLLEGWCPCGGRPPGGKTLRGMFKAVSLRQPSQQLKASSTGVLDQPMSILLHKPHPPMEPGAVSTAEM